MYALSSFMTNSPSSYAKVFGYLQPHPRALYMVDEAGGKPGDRLRT